MRKWPEIKQWWAEKPKQLFVTEADWGGGQSSGGGCLRLMWGTHIRERQQRLQRTTCWVSCSSWQTHLKQGYWNIWKLSGWKQNNSEVLNNSSAAVLSSSSTFNKTCSIQTVDPLENQFDKPGDDPTPLFPLFIIIQLNYKEILCI